MSQVHGLHHVTAISGSARTNLAFWRDVLGLRFVKKTVNFDDPGTYHLYYGDALGRPGSAMTFFPWEQLPQGSRGAGEVAEIAFAVPEGSLDWWARHLAAHGPSTRRASRFGAPVLTFVDPDGLALALVEAPADAREPWTPEGFASAVALRGLQGVTLSLREPRATAELLTGLLDYAAGPRKGARQRFEAPAGSAAPFVDVVTSEGAASQGVGRVHHVAFSVPDDDAQRHVRRRLLEAGVQVTPVVDRDYFRSIYFKSPGGVLFEVATEGPGFTVDEAAADLGTNLKLPKQHEHLRARLEHVLPVLA